MTTNKVEEVKQPLLEGAENQEEAPYAEPSRLTRQQINKCLMDIEDRHPLRSRVFPEHILPILKCCFRKRRPNF